MVVAAADRPDVHGDWSNADEWLPDTMRAAAPEAVCTEAEGRPTAALVRLGYLAEWSGCHDIAARIEGMLPARLPVTYFGSRRRRGRWVKRWRLYDSMLALR